LGLYAGMANLLAMCPDASLRNTQRAVDMAQRAVHLSPKSAWNWQLLGWARYRLGEWQAAIEALDTSIALQV
jgi:Flp pilus assembly protein TadD